MEKEKIKENNAMIGKKRRLIRGIADRAVPSSSPAVHVLVLGELAL